MANRTNKLLSVGALLSACMCLLTIGPAPPIALAQSKGKTETLTGTVGDTSCGMTHMSGDAKKCAVRCVKNMASKYALVVGDKIYTLEGKEAEVEKLAGERAKVTGTIQGATMKVASVSAAKRYAEAPDMD